MTTILTSYMHTEKVEEVAHPTAEERAAFESWAIDFGLELDSEKYAPYQNITNLSWRNWAKTARTPNPAQTAKGEEFTYDSDLLFAKHNSKPLTQAILRTSYLAEYNQGLSMQEAHKAEQKAAAAERRRADKEAATAAM